VNLMMRQRSVVRPPLCGIEDWIIDAPAGITPLSDTRNCGVIR
jgi:hypothetical protein